ncbi:hypothetical protein M8Z33_09710 [Streptomyces sp. ZAF1911]|uniref:hypothetical protein n=1 Tax=Streptomyces sp. ZAF1911 TaxID=2944129 RepID=UPI00237A222D|nr:hypothetical protein [Streptomyces sp. ZAF1911]MDD9376937.1 hypothetical protein [Streptomyces sp. ZAF1911]
MSLTSAALLAPLFTGGAAIIVGAVTRWTQLGIARERVRWEARLENARYQALRFESAQEHLLAAVEAGNRYLAALGSIDMTSFEDREPYLFPLLDAAGRARAEVEALPNFEQEHQVKASLEAMDALITEVSDVGRAFALWEAVNVTAAVRQLSRARTAVMLEVIHEADRPSWLRRRLLRPDVGVPPANAAPPLSSRMPSTHTE